VQETVVAGGIGDSQAVGRILGDRRGGETRICEFAQCEKAFQHLVRRLRVQRAEAEERATEAARPRLEAIGGIGDSRARDVGVHLARLRQLRGRAARQQICVRLIAPEALRPGNRQAVVADCRLAVPVDDAWRFHRTRGRPPRVLKVIARPAFAWPGGRETEDHGRRAVSPIEGHQGRRR
jgi:hypothetical protein